MWLLPTRRRPDALKDFFQSCVNVGISTPGIVLINEDEQGELGEVYRGIQLPQNWSLKYVNATCIAEAMTEAYAGLRDEPWIGIVTDDHIPETAGWDTKLVDAVKGWNIVSSNDGWQAPARMHGAVVFSRELLEAFGWFYPPGFKHMFVDDVWETIGRETGCWQVLMDVMVRHRHASLTGNTDSTVDHTNRFFEQDRVTFDNWLRVERPEVVGRVLELQRKHGVSVMRPNFQGVRLMIATPTMDGCYEGAYATSVFSTMQYLQSVGVTSEWTIERYNADVGFARSKLFAVFLRSKCTHMLWIDADMGWDTNAVNRLFCAGKDFAAVAGPKKTFPMQCAANHINAEGKAIPLVMDATGVAEVSEVGLAFALITRRCAERMVEGYPELEYIGLGGEREWNVFNPMIVNKRYLAEDFAYCVRWRQLGEKLYIAPDIRLQHVGKYTFQGSVVECPPLPEEKMGKEGDLPPPMPIMLAAE